MRNTYIITIGIALGVVGALSLPLAFAHSEDLLATLLGKQLQQNREYLDELKEIRQEQQRKIDELANESASLKREITELRERLDNFQISVPIPYKGAGYPRQGNFTNQGKSLVIWATGTAFKDDQGTMEVDIKIDGKTVGSMKSYTNESRSHKVLNPAIILHQVSPGEHQIELSLKSGRANNEDYSQVTIMELPQ